ncbi:phage baseplate protein [Streptomyces meridianus]|uniref:Teichoic acid biosynthesis protein C n=1 Tax=Streptomyces meridianus TaxID=2938945 RepID=A0ABT0X2B8_9ACTN|nr:teichoic acid biosynthesis protein C [Streptomyces meridianus]MCM2575807.1 teichoic acid biosynthesis protein C [Streptomyces meridianus]
MSDQGGPGRPGRRALLALAGGTAAAALLGNAPGTAAAQAAGRTPRANRPPHRTRSPRGAGGITDERFGLDGPHVPWLTDCTLRHPTVMQSFAFDETHQHLYALQVVPGGVRLPAETRTRPHAARLRSGDLCLNRLTMDGVLLDHMYLKGFGHGSAMGIEERADGGTVLYTECDAGPASGHGRAVARFAYAPGRVLHGDAPGLDCYRAKPGSTGNSVAVDLAGRRLLLRYRRNGEHRYALYDLDGFVAELFDPLADFAQPDPGPDLRFQGMALYGDYAYQVLGPATVPARRTATGPTTCLTCLDLRTGRVVAETRRETSYAAGPMAPEGLAVLRSGGPRLCLGFASGPVGARAFAVYQQQS